MGDSVSLCMIMRDEQEFLAQCLSSVKDFVVQIICIDTGSSDSSIEIAKSFGAEIHTQEWQNDFSLARNLSLQYATGDWVLVLDADELIREQDIPLLKEHLKDSSKAYLMQQRHYTDDPRLSGYVPCAGENPELEKEYPGYFESGLVRLFPNRKGVHYRGRVHELVEHSIYEIPEIDIVASPVRIHHYGHTPEVKSKKKKGDLYTPLGQEKIKDLEKDWKSYFELGVEHNNNLRVQESIAAFEASLKLNPVYLSTWVNYGYVLCQAKRYQDAEKALIQALRIDPQSEEAFCNLGVVEIRRGNPGKAEQYFARAVQIKPLYINARKNLALSLVHQGRISDAVLVLEQTRQRSPRDASVLVMLSELYLRFGDASKVESLLFPVLTASPGELPVLNLLAACCEKVRGAADSVRFLQRHQQKFSPHLSPEQSRNIGVLIDRKMANLFLS